MKALLFSTVTLIGIITFSSCKKTTASSPYYVKATINGVNVVYTGYTAAINSNDGISVYGYNNNAINTADGITLNYTYQPSNLFSGISANQSGVEYGLYSSITSTITAIDSASISGTFSGTISNFDSTKTEIITNGSFYVPF